MKGEKSKSKLTRTSSSLLRSSIHKNLSTINGHDYSSSDHDEHKPHFTPPPYTPSFQYPSSPVLLLPFISLVCVILSFFVLTNYYYYYMSTSENVLLALILLAFLLFFVSKNKTFIAQNWKRLSFLTWKNYSKSSSSSSSVQWYIGEETDDVEQLLGEKSRKVRPFDFETRIVKEGVEFYSNGDFYEGEFHQGRCNGSGVYNYFVNGRYEGDWIDGRYDGYGIESWARGSKYRGQYRQGLRHGYGVYRFFTGDAYSGDWCNGQSYGVGVQTCADGSCFVGEFKSGVKHGLGSYHFRNGDRYSGEYFGDKIHGFGVYHFANGHCYEGSWHEGRKQGYGMYTFRNGETKCGEWDNGNLKTPLLPQTGPVIRAVQAARRTAENAVRVRTVDDKVNRSVMAANKAAMAARVAAVKAVQNRIHGKFCVTNGLM